MCQLCRAEAARDPWAVCLECTIKLPAWARPPTLSLLGVVACLEALKRPVPLEGAAGEPAGPALSGVHVPGVGVVGVAAPREAPSRPSPRQQRHRRWAA